MSVVAGKMITSNKEMENKMVKVALVISTLILGVFAFVIADAYSYTALINDQESYQVLSGQWSLLGTQFVIGSLILALVFIIKSRKK